MEYKIEHKMESIFGLLGIIIASIFIVTAAILTPNYNPLLNTVSSLGEGVAKTLFSIGFVIAGSLGIPFYIQLERELINIKESIRRLATGISIFSCVCIGLVGIIPDKSYLDLFFAFHYFVAFVSFAGTSVYIGLYSFLMYMGGSSISYTGPKFKRYLSYLGLVINIVFFVLLISFQPIVEWILTILILIWILITSIQMLSFKFFNIPGVYYRKGNYPKALNKFEQAFEILNHLELTDEPIMKTLEENISFLRDKLKPSKKEKQ
ncbi:MAG: DUF998 domain-containing protein [Candidatus Lokiarchaeota archaeon]|nr:DUF998 domain-containing protein [Candidatus Lokiarchaeota archaeon]